MRQLNELTSADFSACLNQLFRVHYGAEQPINVTLVEVSASVQSGSPDRRPSFALIFFCPEPVGGSVSSYLRQGTYRFDHETLGSLDVFIVPIGPSRSQGGMQYQAVFS